MQASDLLLRISLLLPLLLAGCANTVNKELISSLSGADIVILGEIHDNAQHHRNQADIINALAPAAVVFEMLTPAHAALANQMADRDRALAEALNWQNSGWPVWPLYRPVFEAVGDTPIYGMALPIELVRRATTEGAAAVFGDTAESFALADPLLEIQQQAREGHQQAVHCNGLPESLLVGMVEAQRLRDASFAQTTLAALSETGGPVIVITGNGHARTDWGMPVALRAAAPAVSVISLGQFEETPATTTPYDVWLVTEPAAREDPCAGFTLRESD